MLAWIFFLRPFIAPGRTGCKSNSDCKVWAECTDGTCHCRAELQGDGNTCNKGGKVHAMVLWVLSLTIAFLWDYSSFTQSPVHRKTGSHASVVSIQTSAEHMHKSTELTHTHMNFIWHLTFISSYKCQQIMSEKRRINKKDTVKRKSQRQLNEVINLSHASKQWKKSH